MSDGYRKQRNTYGNYSGALLVTPFIGASTLVPAKPAGSSLEGSGWTIRVQRLHVQISTPGAPGTTWEIKDSAGNSLTGAISAVSSTTTVGQGTSIPTQGPIQGEFDFGPEGVAITGNLLFVPSGTGASGVISWDAYQKLTSSTGFGS